MASNKPDDLEKLFLGDEVPVQQGQPIGEGNTASVRNGAEPGVGLQYEPSTVLESDWASMARELQGIWKNISLVCNPFLKQDDVQAMLQHWDLWGPLLFTLLLACTLSFQSNDMEVTFSIVFIVIIAGAVLLTTNVMLLGGSVSLLQSISLLGYCMFPLDISAIVLSFGLHATVKIVLISLAIFWSMNASVPFMAGSVGPQRHYLAVYPMALMYAVLGWLIFIAT